MTNEEKLSEEYSDLKYKHGLLKIEAHELRKQLGMQQGIIKGQDAKIDALEQQFKELESSIKEGWVSPKTHRRAIKRYQDLNRLYMSTAAKLYDLQGSADLKL